MLPPAPTDLFGVALVPEALELLLMSDAKRASYLEKLLSIPEERRPSVLEAIDRRQDNSFWQASASDFPSSILAMTLSMIVSNSQSSLLKA